MKPFSEVALFEQGNLSDPFYATGSAGSLGEIPGTFTGPLSKKEQIKISLQVKNSIRMLPTSSSLYYFNLANSQWQMPSASLSEQVGPWDNVSFLTEYSNATLFVEDQLGFDCFGNPSTVGNFSKRRADDPEFISLPGYPYIADGLKTSFGAIKSSVNDIRYIDSQQIKYLTGDYPLSIERNSKFDASNQEIISLDIDQPFLIEKAVFEIPMCLGPGWFKDRTTSLLAHSAFTDYVLAGFTWDNYSNTPVGYLNEGGPGITVSLFSQKKYQNSYIRDLIMNQTVVPSEDAVITGSNIEIYKTYDNYRTLIVVKGVGKKSEYFEVENLSSNNSHYTGSVVLRGTSAVSNGIKINKVVRVDSKQQFINLLASKKLLLLGGESNLISGIDAFGRGMTGFSPSGGSIFGGEYVTSQGLIDADGLVDNPLYVSSSSDILDLASQFNSAFPAAGLAYAEANVIINLSNKKNSPYLIAPGEKLVLCISKCRPAYKYFKCNIAGSNTIGAGSLISSSYYSDVPDGHDVQLATGTINITLYGSYIRAGVEYTP